MDETRELYTLDSTLLGWPGAGFYKVDVGGGTATPIAYRSHDKAYQYYEVSLIEGRGSWWLATAPRSLMPAEWLKDDFGGVEELQVKWSEHPSGIWTRAGGEAVLRPVSALLFIPQDALGQQQLYVPAIVAGQIKGSFPTFAPERDANAPGASELAAQSPVNVVSSADGSVRVESTATGTRITVAPNSQPTVLEINR